MGGEQLDGAEGRHPHLGAGAADLRPRDHLLHDPSRLRQRGEVVGRGHPRGLEGEMLEATAQARFPLVTLRPRQPRQRHDRVAEPGHAGIGLDHHRLQAGILPP